jgi:hypothetical protein
MVSALEQMAGENQFVIFEAADSGVYVQLPFFRLNEAEQFSETRHPGTFTDVRGDVRRTEISLHSETRQSPTIIEVVGNEFLPESSRLSEDQVSRLRKLGFNEEPGPNHVGYFCTLDATEAATVCELAFEVFRLPSDFDVNVSVNTGARPAEPFHDGPPSGLDEDQVRQDISNRKLEFQQAWDAYHMAPEHGVTALDLVRAAFESQRPDAVHDLLSEQRVIDSASRMFDLVNAEVAVNVLRVWSEYLWRRGLAKQAVAILENARATGRAGSSLNESLRLYHYHIAQGHNLPREQKPDPDDQIIHLTRITELGFHFGYVYKLLAEAYHRKGEDSVARECLLKAFELDPNLSGAKTIARILGVSPSTPDSATAGAPGSGQLIGGGRTHRRTREAAATNSDIRSWASHSDWRPILDLGSEERYGAKDRDVMGVVAEVLGRCLERVALDVLVRLAHSVYWEVRIRSYVSLCKNGSDLALNSLRELSKMEHLNTTDQACLRMSIDYLESREDGSAEMLGPVGSVTGLLREAQKYVHDGREGRARARIERLLDASQESPLESRNADPILLDILPSAQILLAKLCAAMRDYESALRHVGRVLPSVEPAQRVLVRRAVGDWLWSYIALGKYDEFHDDLYSLALDIQRDLIQEAATSTELQLAVRNLTRWLEVLGRGELVNWIRQKVIDFAPGYGEERSSVYVRSISCSDSLTSFLEAFETKLKPILEQVLESTYGTANSAASSALREHMSMK